MHQPEHPSRYTINDLCKFLTDTLSFLITRSVKSFLVITTWTLQHAYTYHQCSESIHSTCRICALAKNLERVQYLMILCETERVEYLENLGDNHHVAVIEGTSFVLSPLICRYTSPCILTILPFRTCWGATVEYFKSRSDESSTFAGLLDAYVHLDCNCGICRKAG